jgi:hypothetical protein
MTSEYDVDMEKTREESLLELTRRRDESKGLKILELRYALAESLAVLKGNWAELSKAFDEFEQEISAQPLDIYQQQLLTGFLMKTNRLFHNYLSSVYSLKEHTYVFREALHNTQFREEFQKSLIEFGIIEISSFLIGLRTYMQHKMLLRVRPVIVSIDPASKRNPVVKQFLAVKKATLLEWNRWEGPSKEFLRKQGEIIDLKRTMVEYQRLVSDLYNWIQRRTGELYSKNIEEVIEIDKQTSELRL